MDRLTVGLQRVPLRHGKALLGLPGGLGTRAGVPAPPWTGVADALCAHGLFPVLSEFPGHPEGRMGVGTWLALRPSPRGTCPVGFR